MPQDLLVLLAPTILAGLVLMRPRRPRRGRVPAQDAARRAARAARRACHAPGTNPHRLDPTLPARGGRPEPPLRA